MARGRPTLYTRDRFSRILERAKSMGITNACAIEGISRRTFYMWHLQRPSLKVEYERYKSGPGPTEEAPGEG